MRDAVKGTASSQDTLGMIDRLKEFHRATKDSLKDKVLELNENKKETIVRTTKYTELVKERESV